MLSFSDLKNALISTDTASEPAIVATTAVETALRNPAFKWRTVRGLSEEVGMGEDDVAVTLMALIDTHHVITKRYPNSEGNKMYAIRDAAPELGIRETAVAAAAVAVPEVPAVLEPTHTGLLYKRIPYNRFISTSSEFENAVTSGEKVRLSKLPAMVNLFTTEACYKVSTTGSDVFIVKAGDEYSKFVIA